MNPFSLGLRNLKRNFRRTIVSTLSIGLGLAAIGLFAGYTKTVYQSLELQAIYGELLGHLTVAKQGFYGAGRLDPSQYLFTQKELDQIDSTVQRAFPTATSAQRLSLNGLLSNGKVSTIFVAESLSPAAMQALRGPRSRASGMLDNETPSGVTIARGLGTMMGLAEGADAAVLVSTIHGQANAMDVKVTDTFSTGNIATDDKSMYAPLALAQSLLDAEGRADRVTLLLPDVGSTEIAKATLEREFLAQGLDVTVHTWRDLSAFYRQVKELFDRVFAFLLGIVLVIVAMSVANAMGMSVVERTREIGTLRAIGLRGGGVVRLFLAEALVLVGIGCLVGLLITVTTGYVINAAQLAYVPPNATDAVPLVIGFDGVKVMAAAFALCLFGAAASFVPAFRASRRPVVELLIHV
jgi:putative ABC transport system permease protein